MNIGDRVKCLCGDIDRNQHKGNIGTVEGFARFSQYHAREAYVKFDNGFQSGWFWATDLEIV